MSKSLADSLTWLYEHIDGIDDVRDLLYIFLAIPALALLWWRSTSSNRQARASLNQAKATQEQVALAQSDSLIHRFQTASNSLGSEVISARIAAIYSLMRLAENRPEQFHVQAMELFCAFIRNPPPYPSSPDAFRDDIHTILQVLKRRSDFSIKLEKKQRFYFSLGMAQLSGAALRNSKFARANFEGANLSKAYAEHSDFSHAHLEHCRLRDSRFIAAKFVLANLFYSDLSKSDFQAADFHRANFHFSIMSDANLKYANLTDAHLSATNLEGASLFLSDLSGAHIKSSTLHTDGTIDDTETFCTLTQAQLDETGADPKRPPHIDPGTIDADTGLRIVWCQRLGKENWERLQALKQQGRRSSAESAG